MTTPLRASRILDRAVECEPPDARAARLGRAVSTIVQHAAARSSAFQERLAGAGVAAREVRGLDDLPRIPVLRKDDLPELQASSPPFGDLLGVPRERLARIFASPGPIYDPQGEGDDFWRFRHGLAAAGFRAGEVAHVAASYHLTPLGFMLDAAARALGCVVIPAGVGQTELQARVAHHLGATAYLGTPSFLHALLTRGRETGAPLRLEVAFVLAEMLPESLRSELEREFGVRVLQGYGTADLGCLAYECPEKGGWHLHPQCVVEVLDLETRRPAEPGQPGEVVATIFDEAYPLVRFATGDIAALAPPAPCPCGRSAPKLAGLLGRVGDGVKVKGMFVRGGEIDQVMKRFPEVARWQAVVTREGHQDLLGYAVELTAGADRAVTSRLAEALREQVKVRGEVEAVAPGAIPQGAKRVDDRRAWK
ncbi:MAG TPA: AMP-binding protein [Anaeromyxobacteraceae bacterium]|nr:AMP-binding protein [Anaeromyxobacteraceae bacterium]